MIDIHTKGNAQIISSVGPSSPSNDSDKSSFILSNVESNIDNVSLDLDLMRRIEDFNRNSNVEANLDPDHQLSVNYAHILSALELTIKSMETDSLDQSEKSISKDGLSDSCIDPEQREEQIELLWTNYRTLFPEEHAHMWSSLEHGLSDYLMHLQKREKLHVECDGLRRQNAQLKYMLQEVMRTN